MDEAKIWQGAEPTKHSNTPIETMSASKAGSLNGKGLLQEVLPKLRPFQREALEFATEGKIYDRQWRPSPDGNHNDDNNNPKRGASKPHTQQKKKPNGAGGRLLLADEMGLGKTVTALAIASFYEPEWPLLILCPASLRYTWPAEIEKFFPSLPTRSIYVVAGFQDVAFAQRKDVKIVIVTYSLFQKRSAVAHTLLSEEQAAKFKVVICDESHNLKEKNSQRAEFILPLLKKSKRLLLLSGTPALAKPVELWTQVHALNPNLFGDHSMYTKKFCNPQKKRVGRGRFIWDMSGSSNEKELHEKLRQVMVRRLKADVLSELPPKQRSIVPVTISASEKEACKAAMKELGDSRKSLQELLEQQQQAGATGTGAPPQFNSSIMQAYQTTGFGKAQAVVDYLFDFLAGSEAQKILVFAHHKKVMDLIDAALCRKWPNGHMRIDGSVPTSVRAQLVRQFQTNSRVRVGLLSMTAAGVGLTLTAASTVLFAELHWTPGVLAQAEDRAHRIGTTASSINILYMVCRDESLSLDMMLWRMLGKKIGTLGKIVDGTKDTNYLHAAKEQKAVSSKGTGPQSVQEEVSNFFANEGQVKNDQKTVKGSIESFFKPIKQSNKPTPAKAMYSKTTASSLKVTPPSSGSHTSKRVSIVWKCTTCTLENTVAATPGEWLPCEACGNLYKSSQNDKVSAYRTPSILTQEKKALPKCVDWSCTSCTYINSQPSKASGYYTCHMCSDVYLPDEPQGSPTEINAQSFSINTPSTKTMMPYLDGRTLSFTSSSAEKPVRGILLGSSHESGRNSKSKNSPETIVIDVDKGHNLSNSTHQQQIINIEESSMSPKANRHDVDAKQPRVNRHLLEFRVSANTGRIGIHFASGGDSAIANFDVNDVVTPHTSDRLLESSISRGAGRRLEASDIEFDDGGISKIIDGLAQAPSSKQRQQYERDLRTFVASYLTLREVEKKAIQDAGESFSPTNLVRAALKKSLVSGVCTERYAGGAKERAYKNRDQGTASAVDEAIIQGRACAWCGAGLSSAQQKALSTYCSQDCAQEGRLKRGGRFASSNLRSALYAIEGGVCSICNVSAQKLFKQIKTLQPAERLNKLLNVGWKLPTTGKALDNLLQDPKEGDFWQADHIEAVAEGGGGCGLDNLRTLCVPCHQAETEKLRSRLKLAGPTEEDHGKDLASSAKKRKQLDIRQSLASNTTTCKSKRKK